MTRGADGKRVEVDEVGGGKKKRMDYEMMEEDLEELQKDEGGSAAMRSFPPRVWQAFVTSLPSATSIHHSSPHHVHSFLLANSG